MPALQSAPGTPHEGEEASEYGTLPALLSHGGAPATLVANRSFLPHSGRRAASPSPPSRAPFIPPKEKNTRQKQTVKEKWREHSNTALSPVLLGEKKEKDVR
jgi:hypothetical protein